MSAVEPYEPLNVLKPVADDVWILDGPIIHFGVTGLTVPFPTRMTVIRLPDGGLWLHSPTAPDETLAEAIAALGPVRYLIAPNSIHYWWVADWKARFPEAEVHAAPGLASRAKRAVPIDHDLSDRPHTGWADAIDQVMVASPILTEADFFHRPSRTLVLTDLIENFEPARVRGPLLRGLISLAGAADPDGKAPIDMQLAFAGSRPQVRAAVERMIAWDPERVILAHGRWYRSDGVSELRRAFRWVL